MPSDGVVVAGRRRHVAANAHALVAWHRPFAREGSAVAPAGDGEANAARVGAGWQVSLSAVACGGKRLVVSADVVR